MPKNAPCDDNLTVLAPGYYYLYLIIKAINLFILGIFFGGNWKEGENFECSFDNNMLGLQSNESTSL